MAQVWEPFDKSLPFFPGSELGLKNCSPKYGDKHEGAAGAARSTDILALD
jgi:hypothetical protein